MKAFDVGRVLSLDQLRVLKTHGIDMALPYLDPYNAKACTAQYLRDIAAAGMVVGGFFYETTGGHGQPMGQYHNFTQGKADCARAKTLLASFRAEGLIPASVIVWYADDVHLAPASLFDEYANGIESELGPDPAAWDHQPGVYGWQDLIEHARASYPHWHHLAQTYGQKTGTLDIWQNEQDTIGITIDIDEAYIEGFVPGGTDGMAGVTGDQVKDLIREMLKSPEGADLVAEAIANKYGPALEDEFKGRLTQASNDALKRAMHIVSEVLTAAGAAAELAAVPDP